MRKHQPQTHDYTRMRWGHSIAFIAISDDGRSARVLEQAVFEAQERFEDFESFRTWLKVGASFVDWYPGPKGGVIPVPRSISYAKLEQGAMEQFHHDAVAFLRTEHAGKTLWKHLGESQRIQMIESVLGEFNE